MPILRQGDHLIASIESDLRDTEVLELRDDLAERVAQYDCPRIHHRRRRARRHRLVVARSLASLAITARLRGGADRCRGIQPDVAIARHG